MVEMTFFWVVLGVWLGLALLSLVALIKISAPYGRHMREGWGPRLPRTAGWVIMEAPALLVFLASAFWAASGPRWQNLPALLLSAMFILHYVYRVMIYPFRLRGGNTRMPISIVVFAVFFNMANGYLQGRYLHVLGPLYSAAWLTDPRFLFGGALWAIGWAINLHADEVLLRLRKPGERGYKIPHGGLYRWVSCPNYFGELIEWTGFAVACWSPPAAAFAIWVAANLIPRARTHHLWYRETFGEAYPPARKAVIPFVF